MITLLYHRVTTQTLLCTGIEGWVPGKRFRPMTDMRIAHPKRPRVEATPQAKLLQQKIPHVTEQPTKKIAMTTEEYDSCLAAQLRNDKGIPMEIPVKNTIGKSQLGRPCRYAAVLLSRNRIPLLSWQFFPWLFRYVGNFMLQQIFLWRRFYARTSLMRRAHICHGAETFSWYPTLDACA